MAKYITVDALKGTLERIKADISAISTDGYVTTEALTTALEGYLKEIPAEYITETELNAKGFLTAVPAEYVTEEELTAKGYITGVAEATSEEVLAIYNGTAQAQG